MIVLKLVEYGVGRHFAALVPTIKLDAAFTWARRLLKVHLELLVLLRLLFNTSGFLREFRILLFGSKNILIIQKIVLSLGLCLINFTRIWLVHC